MSTVGQGLFNSFLSKTSITHDTLRLQLHHDASCLDRNENLQPNSGLILNATYLEK